MAATTRKHLPSWDETECLNYYEMLSLHEVFEVVGAQLTEADIDVLFFLLSNTYTPVHPLDPAGWTVKPDENDPLDSGEAPSPKLLAAWRRMQSQGSPHCMAAWCKPKSGFELLLQLERQGYISEGNLEPLLQLLRVLTRHDLLPLVSHKKRRTVSPERTFRRCKRQHQSTSGLRTASYRQAELPLSSNTPQVRTGFDTMVSAPSVRGQRRKKRGFGWSRKPKRARRPPQPPAPGPLLKTSCTIRLRVRAEYLNHESALRNGVSSDKRQPLERQFELFSRADSLLRARDLGAIVCDINFTELENLEAFWLDYLSGSLLDALKGVFINDSLRVAAGSEEVRLLIAVDQDDYEEGRQRLSAVPMPS
ncbi:death effector domain-containing 1 [Corythoichthys intestinalis]|uniref:death effector domain-containing 1 n=1 Tax=Corythoichthys intestinalis TaxID=161448 RepID=UPI0025A55072|nr:death effector domain-containing 1 [Corythoichthys intestinalis]XP_057690472.1 death effector domain-containing 1 [Corythoichthys intestinalis]XP_061789513.1 DNA-binding death effector domain-containing protein 2-like [Nerophis lumbriciformis]